MARKRKKKVNLFYKEITLAILTVIFSIVLINLLNPPKELLIEEKVEESPKTNDFPSSKEGTFVGTITGNAQVSSDEILLFHSANIPGLDLKYYPQELRLKGGTPIMSAERIVIFDGKPHQIAYTFKRFSKQRLFFDGIMVAESDFVWYSGYLTGLVIGPDSAFVSELIENFEISGNEN